MNINKKLPLYLYLMLEGIIFCVPASPVLAQTSQSSNYRFEETSIGGTGVLNTQSANFQAAGSIGVLGIGNDASTNFQNFAGTTTTGDPSLSFAITDSIAEFNPFSAAAASTSTTTFEVVNYTSYGYVVQINGSSPANGGNIIDAMNTTGPSQAGTEQFGINLVANTSPVSVGANPNQGLFGFGAAAANYNTPDNYRFVSGETIASAPKSSGKTIYTISYLINVNALTPGGQYTANQTIIVIGTY